MYHISGKLQDNRLMCPGLGSVTICVTECVRSNRATSTEKV